MYQTLIKPLFSDVKTFLLDTLFPKTCAACGKEGKFLCLYCTSTLKQVEFQQCIICRKPSPYGLTHPRCKTPHAPEGLISFFDYHDKKVSSAIIQGKYSFMLAEIYEIFGKLMTVRLVKIYPQLVGPAIGWPKKSDDGRPMADPTRIPSDVFSLVPIPLSPSRKRWRGFNQAEVLCNTIGKELNMPVIDALQRTKSTKVQKDLKKEARIQNVSGCFSLSDWSVNHKSQISNHKFLIFDDVTTTGSTFLEAAKILKCHGAAEVWCLTVARD